MGSFLGTVKAAMTVRRLLLLSLLVTGGSGYAAFHSGLVQMPTAGLSDMGDWTGETGTAANVATTVWLHNPNPLGINVSRLTVNYAIRMNDVALITGVKEGAAVRSGNQTKTITSTLQVDRIPKWWASHLRNSERSRVAAQVRINVGFLPILPAFKRTVFSTVLPTDIAGMLDRAMGNVEGEYTGPGTTVGGVDTRPRIEIRGGSMAWGQVTVDRTEMKLTFDIHNPNDYPVPVPTLAGRIGMNDVRVADWDANDVSIAAATDRTIAPGGTETVPATVEITNGRIDDWLLSHIRNGERTDGSITVRMRFDIGGVRMYVPGRGGMRCSFSIRTGLLVDRQESSAAFRGCSGGRLPISSDGGSSDNGTGSGSTSDSNTTDSTENTTGGVLGGLTGDAVR